MAVLDFTALGSSMSVRSFARLGSHVSVYGRCLARSSASLAVCGFVQLGASLSLRSFSRLGGQASVMSVGLLGSSMSLRNLARLGSGFSVMGEARVSQSIAVFSFGRLGSMLSVRSCARLGAGISVLGFHHLGASLSLRGCTRMGSALEAFSKIKLNYPGSGYYAYHYTVMEMEATNQNSVAFKMTGAPKAMSFEKTDESGTMTTGGTLHGLWTSDEVIASSGREVKTNIANLEDYAGRCQNFQCRAATRRHQKGRSLLRRLRPRRLAAKGSKPARSLFPLLKELRPVAYRYKDGKTGKGREEVRFGFIADELEELVPEVVREVQRQGKARKGVVYQDLIALLAAGIREHQGRLEVVERQHADAEGGAVRKELKELTAALEKTRREESLAQAQLASTQAELLRVQTTVTQLQQKVSAQELHIATQARTQAEQQRKAQLLDVLRHDTPRGDRESSGSTAGLAGIVTDLQRRLEHQERKLQRVVDSCECAQHR